MTSNLIDDSKEVLDSIRFLDKDIHVSASTAGYLTLKCKRPVFDIEGHDLIKDILDKYGRSQIERTNEGWNFNFIFGYEFESKPHKTIMRSVSNDIKDFVEQNSTNKMPTMTKLYRFYRSTAASRGDITDNDKYHLWLYIKSDNCDKKSAMAIANIIMEKYYERKERAQKSSD